MATLRGMAMAALLLLSTNVFAETANLATGDYSPFVAQNDPGNGVTAALVAAAFKTQSIDVRFEFLPWKRGYQETLHAKYVGTFPYLKTAERESSFLYSEPLYSDQFRMFVAKGIDEGLDWSNKSLCIPLGYDSTQIQEFIVRNRLRIETPSEIRSCFLMLERRRVDAVWVSQLVGDNQVHALFGAASGVHALSLTLVGPVDYFLIVSRQLPDAQKWLSRFNAGLNLMRRNGSYQKIVNEYAAR